jgi:hypothetical protein
MFLAPLVAPNSAPKPSLDAATRTAPCVFTVTGPVRQPSSPNRAAAARASSSAVGTAHRDTDGVGEDLHDLVTGRDFTPWS